ncbi:MAG: septum formation initiator family protein [Rubrivivax sp.]|nr:septum formation initiator family protein [Rubrivivax sp.]
MPLPRWPWATLALTAAIVAVQADLWLNRSNLQQVVALRGQLTEQLAANRTAEERNQRAAAELADLKEGLEMVEEKARRELGMVRADEVLVQYTTRSGPAPGPLGTMAPAPAAPAAPAAASSTPRP